jgi:hypothetical protein
VTSGHRSCLRTEGLALPWMQPGTLMDPIKGVWPRGQRRTRQLVGSDSRGLSYQAAHENDVIMLTAW